MNKEKKRLVNVQNAFNLLDELYVNDCWDATNTRFSSSNQCINILNNSIQRYFETGKSSLLFWNEKTYTNIFEDKDFIEEIAEMMKGYNYNKYKEKIEEGRS